MEPRKIKIYSQGVVPRLSYVAGIILEDILGLSFEIVSDRRKLGKNPVINYSVENITGSFCIIPDTLLFETGISQREIVVEEFKSLPLFFRTTTESDFPFDIFAASFYLISRYEEYLDFQPDEYGRFRASESLAFKNGFLGIPVVDLWTRELSRALLKKYPVMAFRRNSFNSLLTIDTDQPFAYLGKNIIRSFGGMIRDIAKKSGSAGDRYKVVTHEMHDPYEVYDYIFERIESSKSSVKFFFPTADQSKYDLNPSWKNEEYRKLILKTAGKFDIGIHPSYYSSADPEKARTEVDRLKTITGQSITASRFHYLRLFLPHSYRSLIKAGISEDYSMGYPDEPGFRAGIARPFFFYDVAEDVKTNLKIFPFQVMDGTLFQYKKLDAAASETVIMNLMEQTRRAGGLFISLWHNTSLLETSEWKTWRDLFETTLQMQQT
jgi:hypothetical protein